MQSILAVRRRWGHLSIALKLRLAFFLMVFVVLLTASSGYFMLDTVRRKTESAILNSVQIQSLVLEMDAELEQARRLQRDFFLRYPQIGFTEARQQYVSPALSQIDLAESLSKQLKPLIAGSVMGAELEARSIDFNLYLSSAERYADTLRESVDLVTRLANEQDGVQPQLARQSQLIQETLEQTHNDEWIEMNYKIDLYELDYLVSRRRSVMQSALNMSTILQQAIRASDQLGQEQKVDLLRSLLEHDATAQQVVDLDASIRSKLNDFELQAESVDPISDELVQMANEQVQTAREDINATTRVANLVLVITGLAGVLLALIIADVLNKSVTKNVVKLTRAARDMEAGNLHTVVRISSEDEFGNLAHAFNSMAVRLQNLFSRLQSSETRYRSLFENSPISLWEEDFSAVREHIDRLRTAGVQNWQAYFSEHPAEVQRMATVSYVVDVNRAALELLKCDRKEMLLGSLERFFDAKTWGTLAEELSELADGRLTCETESFLRDFQGGTLFVHVRSSVVPGYENSWSKVLVSISDITEREQRERELASIAMVSAAMRTANSRAQMLPVILDQPTQLLGAGGVALAIRDPGTGEMRVEQARGELDALFPSKSPESGPAIVVGDGAGGQVFSGLHDDQTHSVIYVPLAAQGSTIGTLWVSREAPLRQPEIRILNAISDIAANAIHRATLFEATLESAESLSKAYEATIEGWSRALDLRDKETEGHTQRVTTLTLQLARAMGMDEADLVHIRRGALLHDIGKMGVPDEILRKPGPLDDKEWRVMRLHPELALSLISPIAYLHQALDIPYCHHEKWDGSGYPRGLKGEEIPLAARIFSVVDVWDALLSDRPYRLAWERERVLEYLHEHSGKFFDPRVVEEFIWLQEREDSLMNSAIESSRLD